LESVDAEGERGTLTERYTTKANTQLRKLGTHGAATVSVIICRQATMAALLRHGAVKRLGRSMVQRAQVAAVEERRRRFMHTDEVSEPELASIFTSIFA
jgi:predicted Zn-dependent protease